MNKTKRAGLKQEADQKGLHGAERTCVLVNGPELSACGDCSRARGGRSPLSPTCAACRAAAPGRGKRLQASWATAAQAAPGERPCTATAQGPRQPQSTATHATPSHKAGRQEANRSRKKQKQKQGYLKLR